MLGHDFDLGVTREFPPDWSWSSVLRNDPCAYCGEPSETVDHIVPKGRGGRSSASQNGTGSCYHCNHIKRRIPLLDFLLARERLNRSFNRRQKAFFSAEQVRQMRKAVA